MKPIWIVVAVGVALAAGCKKKQDTDWSVFDKLYSANAPALKAMCGPAIAMGANTPPPLTADTVTDAGPLTADNAVVLSETMAAVLAARTKTESSPQPNFLGGTMLSDSKEFDDICNWATAASAFRGQTPDGFTVGNGASAEPVRKAIDDAIKHVLATRYIVVVHVTDYTSPIVKDGYVPGKLAAEARIIDAKGASHGGFRFAAVSSSGVNVTKTVDGKGKVLADNSTSSVERDLAMNAGTAFAKALAAAVPGSTLKLPIN